MKKTAGINKDEQFDYNLDKAGTRKPGLPTKMNTNNSNSDNSRQQLNTKNRQQVHKPIKKNTDSPQIQIANFRNNL